MRSDQLIVHIAAYFPPHTGGLERVAKTCADGLSNHGRRVHVITSTLSGLPHGVTRNGNLTTTVLRGVEFAHFPFAPGFILAILKLPKNSILHLHLAHGFFPEVMFIITKIRKIKYVVHFHLDVAPSGAFGFLFRIYKKIVWGPLLRNATHIIACANDQITIMHNKWGIAREKITVIPNAVSDDFFSKKEYDAPRETFRLLYIGRLAKQKRVERIVGAMAKLNIPASLTIVGDGEDFETLRSQASQLKLTNINFVGKKNDIEMQEYHQTHDVFLISSDKEGMPLVVLEAMAGGLPIIATNVEGLAELVTGTGVMIEEPYEENFAKAITQLWQNPETLIQLSKKSRAKATLYGWSSFINALQAVYREYL